MNNRMQADPYGQKAIAKRQETLPMIGGHFHGQLYTFTDTDSTSIRMLIPAPVPVMVEAMQSGKDEIDVTVRTQSYTRMKWEGNAFMGCTDLTRAELMHKIYEYRSKQNEPR